MTTTRQRASNAALLTALRFDRIGLLAAPYVAGSYAEGTYEVTLPVTPKVLDAVKPEYKAAFALAK